MSASFQNVAKAASQQHKANQQAALAARPPPEPESLRKLRALKERITREYEQEKREREAMENTEPVMPISLANEKSVVGTNKDGSLKMWGKKEQMHPARVGYGAGHVPLNQEPADYLKEKMHQLKGTNNKAWQNDLEQELSGKFGEMTQLKSQNRRLREILTLREASNTRKEAKLESEIAQLKNLMDDVCIDTHNHEEIIDKLRNMNYEIQEKADLLKSTIEEQAEADRLALIRTYRVRIRDVRQQLANQEALNLEGAKAWIARFEMIESDRKEAAEYLAVIERENRALREAKLEIRVMQKHQNEQRKDLTHKIALVKRENKRFEEHIARLEKQLGEGDGAGGANDTNNTSKLSTSSAAGPAKRSASRQGGNNATGVGNRLFMTTNVSRSNTPGLNATTLSTTVPLTSVPPPARPSAPEDKLRAEAAEQQQTEAIVKIRRVLEMIRTSLRQVRSAHIELLQERTELEIFLRKCIDDVRKDMHRAVSSGVESGGASGGGAGSRALGAVSPSAKSSGAGAGAKEVVLLQQYGVKERRQLMDILNSKLQLLNRLHQTMFPHKTLPEALGDRLGPARGAASTRQHLSAEEIGQTIQFDSDVDTLWQRWQTWVRTESPAPTFGGAVASAGGINS